VLTIPWVEGIYRDVSVLSHPVMLLWIQGITARGLHPCGGEHDDQLGVDDGPVLGVSRGQPERIPDVAPDLADV